MGAPVLSRSPLLGLQQQGSCAQMSGCAISNGLGFPIHLMVLGRAKIISGHAIACFCSAGSFDKFSFYYETINYVLFLYFLKKFQLTFRSTVKSPMCICMS